MADRLPPGVREAVYLRDGFSCVLCSSRAVNIHHRKPAGRGQGDHTPPNLLSLCGSGTTGCHGWIEQNRAYALDLGWLLPQDTGDTSTPVWRPSWRSWQVLYDNGHQWGAPPDWRAFRAYSVTIEDAWERHCPDRIDGQFAAVTRELCRSLWRKGTPASLVEAQFARWCDQMLPGSMPPSLAARWAFAAGWADSEWHTISERWG